jgi:small-conductance mechanosensitive channel
LLIVTMVNGSFAQTIPGLPTSPAPPSKDSSKREVAAPTSDNPQATVAEASGKIDVDKEVDEFKVKDFLEETLAKYPGVYNVHAEVDGSVVTLTGHVENEAVRDRLGQVALKVEGVVFVANQLKTDAQVLSAPELLGKQLNQYGSTIAQNWLLFLLALGIAFASILVAQFFSRYSEILLAPLTGNVLLRSVLGSILSAAIVGAGVLAAFQVFGLAHAVTSMLGLAGIAALAIGFAFRDITENFIASILLSTRRPFNVGDYIEVAGQAGVVKALNTRATVLLTLEGRTVRISNATVFKETVSNSSSATSARSTFDVLIPYEVSTIQAMDLIGQALREHEAILNDPPPRALVEELSQSGVKLRAYFWIPSTGVDGFKVVSDAKLKAKVALQQAGIRPPAMTYRMVTTDSLLSSSNPSATNGDNKHHDSIDHGPVITRSQARANLAQDMKGAAAAAEVTPKDDVMEHVRSMSGGDVTTEGTNLIASDPKQDETAPKPPEGEPSETDPKPAESSKSEPVEAAR